MKTGTYTKNLSGKSEYYSFKPMSLYDFDMDMLNKDTLRKVLYAYLSIGEFNGVIDSIKNKDLFIGSYIRLEALNSSLIEGTQATIDDIFSTNRISNDDIEEVLSNIKALKEGKELLNELPICLRFIKNIHKILMTNSRGKEDSPGEFRRSQNWIGHMGSTLNTASYIPPNVNDMGECLNDLEKYINDSNVLLEPIINSALIHYQFESIHPFLDGNGRTGRILILLYLYECGILKYPCLYISYYMKKNQSEYYLMLKNVREKSDYNSYISFFMDAIIETCKDSINKIKQINELSDKNNCLVFSKDQWLLSYIEEYPLFDSNKVSIDLSRDYQAVNRTIKRYLDLGIITIKNNSKKNRCYKYKDYLDILKQ